MPEKYIHQPYPKWVHAHEAIDGVKRIVKTREEHEAAIGKLVNEDGTLVVDPDGPEDHSKPPSVEFILSRAYTQEAAESIHAKEQEKFDKGYPPYGKNVEPPVPPPDAAHEPTQAEREAVFAPEKIQAGQTEPPAIIEAEEAEPQPEVAAPKEDPITEPIPASEVPRASKKNGAAKSGDGW